MIIRLIIIGLGLLSFFYGIYYNDTKHKKFKEKAPYASGFIESIISELISLLPWYFSKIFYLLIGIALIFLGVFIVE